MAEQSKPVRVDVAVFVILLPPPDPHYNPAALIMLDPDTGTANLWIGAADGLPHQSDSEFKVATYANKSHIVYEYNGDIKVEKPSI